MCSSIFGCKTYLNRLLVCACKGSSSLAQEMKLLKCFSSSWLEYVKCVWLASPMRFRFR